jgi:heat shock protein HtpX
MFIFGDRDSDNNSPIAMLVGIVVLILAPIAAAIVQMAVSRQREFLADATSAMTTRNPEALATALEKLKTNGRPMQRQSSASAHLFFADPLKPGVISKLFSTHPPLDERIQRLRENEGKF